MITKIPVLDLMNGIAVSGKSGKRDKYTPLKTIFSSGSDPVEIANSLKLNGVKEIYLADLDLIEKKGHNINTIKMISHILPVIFDGGVSDLNSFKFFLEYAFKVVVASETIDSLEEFYKIFEAFPKERIVVSVDIKDNELYSKNLDLSLIEFKEVLYKVNPNEIILLDISNVGTGKGINPHLLNVFSEFKNQLIIGGGLNKDSIKELYKKDIKKVLVGTSLHLGEISLI